MNKELARQVKPLYAQVGAVVQSSQQMEMGIGFALTMLKQLNASSFSNEEFDDSMDVFSSRTLGRLISELRKQFEFDENGESALQLALEERNYIIHRMFSQDIEIFTTKDGREKMRLRIKGARNNINVGIQILDGIIISLMELSGMSFEDLMEDVRSNIEV